MSGLSWFGVEVITSLPSAVLTNHARPEPKRDNAAWVNCSLNASTEPNDVVNAFSTVDDIFDVHAGASNVQKKE